jgi:hypothetical protein
MKLEGIKVGGEYGLNIVARKNGVVVGILADDTRYGLNKATGQYEANPKGKTLAFLVNGEPTFVHVRNVIGTPDEARAKFEAEKAEKAAKEEAKKAERSDEWQVHATASKHAALPESLVAKLFEAAEKGAETVTLTLSDFKGE